MTPYSVISRCFLSWFQIGMQRGHGPLLVAGRGKIGMRLKRPETQNLGPGFFFLAGSRVWNLQNSLNVGCAASQEVALREELDSGSGKNQMWCFAVFCTGDYNVEDIWKDCVPFLIYLYMMGPQWQNLWTFLFFSITPASILKKNFWNSFKT